MTGLVLQSAEVYHWYVSEPLPPEGFAVSVTDCPSSIVGLEGDIDPGERAGSTVRLGPETADEPVFDPLSVTVAQK